MSRKAAGRVQQRPEDLEGFISSLLGAVLCLDAVWNLFHRHRGELKCALKLPRDLSDLYPPDTVTFCLWNSQSHRPPILSRPQETSSEASDQGREPC